MGAAERSADKVQKRVAKVPRRVVVAGDVTVDWNLARTRRLLDGAASWNAEDRTETYGGLGGAAVLDRLVEEVGKTLSDEGFAVEVEGPPAFAGPLSPGDPRFNHSFALWSQQPRRKGDRDRSDLARAGVPGPRSRPRGPDGESGRRSGNRPGHRPGQRSGRRPGRRRPRSHRRRRSRLPGQPGPLAGGAAPWGRRGAQDRRRDPSPRQDRGLAMGRAEDGVPGRLRRPLAPAAGPPFGTPDSRDDAQRPAPQRGEDQPRAVVGTDGRRSRSRAGPPSGGEWPGAVRPRGGVARDRWGRASLATQRRGRWAGQPRTAGLPRLLRPGGYREQLGRAVSGFDDRLHDLPGRRHRPRADRGTGRARRAPGDPARSRRGARSAPERLRRSER